MPQDSSHPKEVPGFLVGHLSDHLNHTGCTVILCAKGAIAGVDIRGPMLGTREIDLVRSGQLVRRINAVVFTGGSVFGMVATAGVMKFLEERQIGFKALGHTVPIVAGAAVFDSSVATPDGRLSPDSGYQACINARKDGFINQGQIGAGVGARIGKQLGVQQSSPGGIGVAFGQMGRKILAALAVVNCFGCVLHPDTHLPISGPHDPSTGKLICDPAEQVTFPPEPWANNVLVAIVTDVDLSKRSANDLASIAYDGIIDAIRSSGPSFDSSAVFVLSSGDEPDRDKQIDRESDLSSLVCELASNAIASAAIVASR